MLQGSHRAWFNCWILRRVLERVVSILLRGAFGMPTLTSEAGLKDLQRLHITLLSEGRVLFVAADEAGKSEHAA